MGRSSSAEGFCNWEAVEKEEDSKKKSRPFLSEDGDVTPDKLWLELALVRLLATDAQQEVSAPRLFLIRAEPTEANRNSDSL